MKRPFIVISVLVFTGAACSSNDSSGSAASSSADVETHLTVFAASSLTAVFHDEIGPAFEAQHEGLTITSTSAPRTPGGSDPERGHRRRVRERERHLDGRRAGRPGCHRPVGLRDEPARDHHAPGQPGGHHVDRRPREAGACSSCSRPRAYRSATTRVRRSTNAGILTEAEANVVSNEEDNASVVAKITAGEADAAIVYTSDISSAAGNDVRAVDIPDDVNVIATYPIAVVAGAPDADARRRVRQLRDRATPDRRRSRRTGSARHAERDALAVLPFPLVGLAGDRCGLRRAPGRRARRARAVGRLGRGARRRRGRRARSGSRSWSRSPPPRSRCCSACRSRGCWHGLVPGSVGAARDRRAADRAAAGRRRHRTARRARSERRRRTVAVRRRSGSSSPSRRGERSSPRRSCRCRSSCSRPRPACGRSTGATSRRRRRSARGPGTRSGGSCCRCSAPQLAAGAVLAWARALGEFGATITFAGNLAGRDPDPAARRVPGSADATQAGRSSSR